MAVVTIGEVGNPSADYNSWSAVDAGESKDRVTATDSLEVQWYNDWPTGKTGYGDTVTGWTTNDTYRLIVGAVPGDEHDGVPDAGVWFNEPNISTPWHVFRIDNDYVTIKDLQWSMDDPAGRAGLDLDANQNGIEVYRCIFIQTNNGDAECLDLRQNSSGDPYIVESCLFINEGTGRSPIRIDSRGTPRTVRNCTFIAESTGPCVYLNVTGAEISFAPTMENCVFYGDTWSGATMKDYLNMDTNAFKSGIDLTPGTNPITGLTSAAFVDYAGGDYRPADGGALDNAGLTVTAGLLDVAGNAFVTNDVGCFVAELAASLVNNDSSQPYNISAFLNNDSSQIYNISAFLSKDSGFPYRILEPISSDNELPYSVLELTSNDLNNPYNISQLVGRNTALTYNLLELINADNQHIYQVLSLSAVNNDLSIIYNISEFVNTDNSQTYNLSEFVFSNNVQTYNLSELVFSDSQHVYAVEVPGLVQSELSFIYQVLNFINSDSSQTYNVLDIVNNSNQLIYSVFESAINDLSITYNIASVIASDLENPYNINAFVNADSQIVYNLYNLANNDLEITYNIEGIVGNSVNTPYDIISFVFSDSGHIYRILYNTFQNNQMIYRVNDLGTTADLSRNLTVAGQTRTITIGEFIP